jgi:hypothetical protein
MTYIIMYFIFSHYLGKKEAMNIIIVETVKTTRTISKCSLFFAYLPSSLIMTLFATEYILTFP